MYPFEKLFIKLKQSKLLFPRSQFNSLQKLLNQIDLKKKDFLVQSKAKVYFRLEVFVQSNPIYLFGRDFLFIQKIILYLSTPLNSFTYSLAPPEKIHYSTTSKLQNFIQYKYSYFSSSNCQYLPFNCMLLTFFKGGQFGEKQFIFKFTQLFTGSLIPTQPQTFNLSPLSNRLLTPRIPLNPNFFFYFLDKKPKSLKNISFPLLKQLSSNFIYTELTNCYKGFVYIYLSCSYLYFYIEVFKSSKLPQNKLISNFLSKYSLHKLYFQRFYDIPNLFNKFFLSYM
ncbi:hypothetical protein TTHERM_000564439 (macronuclear) [Tetrahymena thermophila SB210]|uniref:Uncharacterized protein n=1 Tax=Tetrahymena thermophila (strain SB210) TaxID=312017 RepID=W7XFN2_TETTS|nr:hypothetical protein TTHERM_000564439 [Tetrahymena thermophila SB210]EWS72816.1 hypothetical protein TTHERM_000564439 [Tetrahymena thermophila SB210]|eukprot:XP_012654642.1 hypothetical protein TTHERM_000564439 [Tetrahymena thermophila SB210]